MALTEDRKTRLAWMRKSESSLTAQLRAAKTGDERVKLRDTLTTLQRNISAVELAGRAAVSKPKAKPTPKRSPSSSTPPAAAAPMPPTRTTTITALRRTDRALVELLRQPGLTSTERSNTVGALTDIRAELVARGEPLPPVAAAPTRDARLERMDRVVRQALGLSTSKTVNIGGFQLVGTPDGWRPY